MCLCMCVFTACGLGVFSVKNMNKRSWEYIKDGGLGKHFIPIAPKMTNTTAKIPQAYRICFCPKPQTLVTQISKPFKLPKLDLQSFYFKFCMILGSYNPKSLIVSQPIKSLHRISKMCKSKFIEGVVFALKENEGKMQKEFIEPLLPDRHYSRHFTCLLTLSSWKL